jgi:glycosyl transferase family 25
MDQTLFEYFDRTSVIHLPTRSDRMLSLTRELKRIGVDIDSPKISFPVPPMPEHASGFPSRGVHGNFLSHLGIIEDAHRDNLETVFILEDDAIFSNRFKSAQANIVEALKSSSWDMCFIGHSLTSGLPSSPTGLIPFSGPFLWAHCYAIHRRIMPRLIEYMTNSIAHPSGHPEGGRMYIDGAYTLFRRLNPDVRCFVSSPCLSIQRGSPSSLNARLWYDKNGVTSLAVGAIRRIRDEGWRRGWFEVKTPSAR